MERAYPNLFSPFKTGRFTFKNRILSAPVSQPFYSDNGRMSRAAFAYLEEQAKGGVAQVTIGDQPVDPELSFGKGFDINRDEIPNGVMMSLSAFTFAMHQHGAYVSIELGHPGEGMHFPPDIKGRTIGPMGYIRKEDGVEVVALNEPMMEDVCEMFARCASNLKKAGFDGCVLHGGHGCLIAQFLSARTNKRTDKFGGSMENRARFPIMILDRIRERAGKDFIIEVRLSGDELVEGGIHTEDTICFCKLIEGKADLVHISAGIYSIPELFVRIHSSIYYPSACNAYLAEAIRKEIKTPVITVGAINDPAIAEHIIASGQADFVALGRQLIADPFFARKSKENRAGEITPCIRCLNCMAAGEPGTENLQCSVNPRASREYRIPETRAAVPVKVAVIGGGPGGMKAAITAAELGHNVILFEKTNALGGTLKFTDNDICKFDLKRYKDHLVSRVNSLNIDVRLNTNATPGLIEAERAYAVIAAIGSDPVIPQIPGIDGKKVFHALEAYEDISMVGERVIMIGGGMAGCETAVHLGKLGKNVTLIEMTDTVAADCKNAHIIALMEQLRNLVDVKTGLECMEITGSHVKACDRNGKEFLFEADTVIYALGMAPRKEEAAGFIDTAIHYYSVGDCVKAGKVVDAVRQGYFSALDI